MNITVYKSNSCGACATVVPIIKKLAHRKGIRLNIIDVDECGKKCDNIKYVPLIEVDGQRVSDYSKLVKILS